MVNHQQKIAALEHFQRFLNKYELVCKKAFSFGGILLHPAEIHTLEFIRSKQTSFVSEIAKEMGTTRGAASQMVLRLKKKALLSQAPDRRNKSRQLLEVTAKGLGACLAHKAHHEAKDAVFHAWLDALDNPEMATMKSLFGMMDGWMDNYL